MKRLLLILAMFLIWMPAISDDGQMFRRNISKTPDLETEHAAIKMMNLYIPAQNSSGELTPVEYYNAEGVLAETKEYAKPLLGFYTDGPVEHVPDIGFSGHGKRDFFAAVSLDDGNTYKRRNLSNSAKLSSIKLGTGRNKVKYPGDVIGTSATVSGNKVFAAWASRYCDTGKPSYTLTDEERSALAVYLVIEADDLYLADMFGVAGSQGYSDFADKGYPQVGLVPYACLWTARGTLEQDEDTGLYDVIWRQAERVTSGKRDVNRVQVAAAGGAGFVVTWQEDPDGLRPGQGEGPGAGWSGAIAHQQTDIWYTHISWQHFGKVKTSDDDATPIHYSEYTGDNVPKVAIPMSMPVRLSDNAQCKAEPITDEDGDPYCYEDFDGNGVADLCAEPVSWTNPGGATLNLCQTEDGRVLWGRTAATRARVKMHPYVQDGDDAPVNAWVVIAYEETKALGEGSEDDAEEPIDIGKNIRYQTFGMFNPELVEQGLMLNHPAKDYLTGEYFEMAEDDWGNPFYETEIARRASLLTQSVVAAGGEEGDLVAMPLFKQGIINQGGPSDIMARRFVIPEAFDPHVDNPYAYGNMVCDTWEYTDASNPIYLLGLCMDTPINVSATNIVSCDAAGAPAECVDLFPWEDGEPGTFPIITEWQQTANNLDDESWENPYDVAKGHRGYLDGDNIMLMYAWSPNWKANSVGHDKYNLYVRRSFDAGLTWTTTPAALGGTGTCHIENYLDASVGDDGAVETCYAADEFEQARNVSQFTGTKITVLDPRFAKTSGGYKKLLCYDGTANDGFGDWINCGYTSIPSVGPPYLSDIRDPSHFFIVYETGDNTTTAEGEATPLDLFFSRTDVYGDEYDYVEVFKDGELVLEFDWLEHDSNIHASEASVLANPAGSFFYAAWNQWQEDAEENIFESDAWVRRIMYLDDYVPPTTPIDADGDGYFANAEPYDCDDNDASINPGAIDRGGRFRDGIDNDCDGIIDG